MENLVSSWCTTVKSLPQNYIFPYDARPGNQIVPIFKDCPVIDLEKVASGHRDDVIQQILKACQDYGFFQVINHGVCEDLINDTMGIVKEFFNMPNKDKVISNGEFESVHHRAVTTSKESRYTIASFINPCNDTVIEPAKELIEKDNSRPLFQAYSYKDFFHAYEEHRGEGEATLEVFKIKG